MTSKNFTLDTDADGIALVTKPEVTIDRSGRGFVISGLAPGRYVARLNRGLASWYLRSVTYQGRDVTQSAFEIIVAALADAGFGLPDVVRTRMFVTDMGTVSAVLAVHGELFAGIRPAATIVQVGALIEPSLLVEIEVVAVKDAK